MKRAVAILLLGFAASCFAQQPGRVMTLTRTVTLFSGLENTLDDALRAHDAAALAKLVAPTFEVRTAAMPGTPVPRADWLAAPLPPKPALSQMAVHDYGDVAVVSFLDAARHAFVVDVWSKKAGDYMLSVRYTSDSAGAAQTRPENPAK